LIKKYKLPKLALEIIGYLTASIMIASFSFSFLYLTSSSLMEKIAPEESDLQLFYMLGMICALGAMVIFFAFFLLFLGKKISYILSINKGVQILKGDITFRVECEGDDELTELADTINIFAAELQRYKENEDRLKKEKEILIKSLSHDIRTPLTSIISYSDFIKSKQYQGDESLDKYIEVIQNKAYQIQELTDLLLNVDEKQDDALGEMVLEGKVFFEQLVSELEGALEYEDFQVDVDKDGLGDFKIRLNVQDMTRVFDNLYSNIIKYANPQEKIWIQIYLQGEELTIVQTNKIKEKNIKGTQSYGIGIKSMEQIIKKYQGEINVMSDPKNYKIEIRVKV
jgi:signal transduction histidine kinase